MNLQSSLVESFYESAHIDNLNPSSDKERAILESTQNPPLLSLGLLRLPCRRSSSNLKLNRYVTGRGFL
jgi:hypothetical protein